MAQTPKRTGERPPQAGFPTTRWSIVLEAAGRREEAARAALESLCRTYWFPIYAHVRRSGRSHHEAEDCTQAFLAHLLEIHGFEQARQDRGRFRTFLLSSLRHFMINAWLKEHAQRRGGGLAVLSLDWEEAEYRFRREPADRGLSPEQAFDRACARELVRRATDELAEEYASRGRERTFAVLSPLLLSEPGREPLAPLARELGMTAHAVAAALKRLRTRLGRNLRARVAETVARPEEVDAELRHLIDSLGSGD